MSDGVWGAAGLIIADLLIAATLWWSTWAPMTGRLGPNPAVGIRTSSTLRDGSAWRAGHRAAWPIVKWTAVSTLVLAAVALVLLVMGQVIAALIIAFVPVVIILVSLIPSVRRARRAAEAAPLGD